MAKATNWYRDPLIWLALALVVPVFVWMAISLIGWKHFLSVEGTTWAAWVQAIGSILALFVAFRVSASQLNHARQQQRWQEVDRVAHHFASFMAVGSALVEKASALEVMATSVDSMAYHCSALGFETATWGIYVNELNGLKATDLPTRIGIEQALKIRAHCTGMENAASAALNWTDNPRRFELIQVAQLERHHARQALDAIRLELVRYTSLI